MDAMTRLAALVWDTEADNTRDTDCDRAIVTELAIELVTERADPRMRATVALFPMLSDILRDSGTILLAADV
jgi:hypothetical protein